MHTRSLTKSLNYKLRELELIIKQLDDDTEPARIDIDLALDKTRELYDILLRLNSGKPEEPVQERNSIPHVKPVVPSDPELTENEKAFETEDIIPDPVHKQIEQPRPEEETEEKSGNQKATQLQHSVKGKPEKDEEPSLKTGQKAEPKEIKEKEVKKKRSGSQEIEIVADRYQSSQNYINQALADKKSQKDLTTKHQSKPISDLRNSIGINEKFLFIKELFKGRPENYNICIDTLNQSSSYDEALNYLKTKFNWEEDNEIAEKLLTLVKRKHQAE